MRSCCICIQFQDLFSHPTIKQFISSMLNCVSSLPPCCAQLSAAICRLRVRTNRTGGAISGGVVLLLVVVNTWRVGECRVVSCGVAVLLRGGWAGSIILGPARCVVCVYSGVGVMRGRVTAKQIHSGCIEHLLHWIGVIVSPEDSHSHPSMYLHAQPPPLSAT